MQERFGSFLSIIFNLIHFCLNKIKNDCVKQSKRLWTEWWIWFRSVSFISWNWRSHHPSNIVLLTFLPARAHLLSVLKMLVFSSELITTEDSLWRRLILLTWVLENTKHRKKLNLYYWPRLQRFFGCYALCVIGT